MCEAFLKHGQKDPSGKQEEMLLLVFGVADAESEKPLATALYLNVFSRGENGAHQSDVEQVATITALRNFLYCDGHAELVKRAHFTNRTVRGGESFVRQIPSKVALTR